MAPLVVIFSFCTWLSKSHAMDCLFYDILYFIIILNTYDHSSFFDASVPTLRKPEKSDESHHLMLIFIISDCLLLNQKNE